MWDNGDSTLIITPSNKTVLIDGGEGKQEVLLPYLLDRRINRIDYMIISHFDSDHCNGLIPVIEELDIKNIIISKQSEKTKEFENIMKTINTKKTQIRIVKQGDRLNIDEKTYIDILYPEENLKYDDLNNNSIVAKLNYGKFSMLFAADITETVEKNLVGETSSRPRTDTIRPYNLQF